MGPTVTGIRLDAASQWLPRDILNGWAAIEFSCIQDGRTMGLKTAVLLRHWLQIGLVALVGAGVAQGQFLQSENTAEKRLRTLSHLPAGVWHYHTGDVAHGEDPSLSDSDWPVARPNSTFPTDTLWF